MSHRWYISRDGIACGNGTGDEPGNAAASISDVRHQPAWRLGDRIVRVPQFDWYGFDGFLAAILLIIAAGIIALMFVGCAPVAQKANINPIGTQPQLAHKPLVHLTALATNGSCITWSNLDTAAVFTSCPTPPRTNVVMAWSCSQTNNIVFLIYAKSSLDPGARWFFYASTSATQFTAPVDMPEFYFKVRASNTVTHLVSTN